MAYPIQWSGYFLDALTKKNTLYSQGAVNVSFTPENMRAGEISERYYNDDIESYVTDTLIASASTQVTPGAMTSDVEKHAVVQNGFGMKESMYDAIRKGGSGLDGALTQVASTIQRKDQVIMNSVLTGVFASGGALRSSHYESNTANAITGDLITQVAYDKLGEAAEDVNILIINSAHKKKLLNEFVPQDAATFRLPFAGQVETLGNMRVLVNDTICASQDSGVSYPAYMLGAGALFTEYYENLRIAEDTKADTGGETKEYYVYRMAKYGVNGVGWSTSTAPTAISDYETAGNYTKKLDNKQILLLRSDFAV